MKQVVVGMQFRECKEAKLHSTKKKGVIMLCEPVWIHDGADKREWFEKGLEPDILADDLQRYKMLCSKDFNMSDLLKLKEIQALALLAEAIIDLPEYLTDKIGKMRLDIPEHTITGSLDEIGNALNVISESI